MVGTEASRVRPFFPGLSGYTRAWLAGDVIAGLTLAAVCVPESMADARLAAMPPVTGLYAFLAGALAAALLSSSRQLSLGPDSTIGPMMAVGVAAVGVASGPTYAGRIVLLAVILGIAVAAAGLARLGFLADLLSRPVMTGFLSGVGITVVIGQLHGLAGLPATSGSALDRLIAVLDHLGAINGATVAVGVAVVAVVLGGELVDRRIPGALVALVGSLAAVAALGLGDRGVALVGSLPPGLPALSVPRATAADLTALIPTAVPIFFVTLAQTAATSRGFAVAGGYEVRIDRDFVAVGAASLVSSLTGSFAVNASPTRTAVVAASAGRSQVVNLIAAALVVAVLLVATGVLANLPEATLAGILIAVGVKLVKWRDLVSIARYSRAEAAIALATMAVVALVGIQQGIYLAIALALVERTYLSARPHDAVLGRLPGSDGVWLSHRHRPDAAVPPGISVFRFDAPLFYANAEHFAARVRDVLPGGGDGRGLVIEAVGIDDLDFTGAHVLGELDDELRRRGITVMIAHPFGRLGTELTTGSLAARFRGRVWNSVDEAVAGLGAGPAPAPAAVPERPRSSPPA